VSSALLFYGKDGENTIHNDIITQFRYYAQILCKQYYVNLVTAGADSPKAGPGRVKIWWRGFFIPANIDKNERQMKFSPVCK
jgi:hypothetical protein